MKEYTLKEFYELEKEILTLRTKIINGDLTFKTRERLLLLESEFEMILPQILFDIENGKADYSYNNYSEKKENLTRAKKI